MHLSSISCLPLVSSQLSLSFISHLFFCWVQFILACFQEPSVLVSHLSATSCLPLVSHQLSFICFPLVSLGSNFFQPVSRNLGPLSPTCHSFISHQLSETCLPVSWLETYIGGNHAFTSARHCVKIICQYDRWLLAMFFVYASTSMVHREQPCWVSSYIVNFGFYTR